MKIIHRITFSLLMMTFALVANAQTSLSVEDFDIQAGGEATFEVNMDNEGDQIWAVQFDMALPEGITFKSASLVSARANGHDEPTHNIKDGKDRITVTGDWDFHTFKGNQGAIIKITVQASNSFTTGKIGFSTIRFTKMVNDTPTSISGTDFNVILNPSMIQTLEGVKLYLEATSLQLEANSEGVAQGVMAVNLDNPKYMPNALMFELTLPYGLKVASVTNTERSANLTARPSVKDNGNVKVIMADMGKKLTITGDNGAICNITFEATDEYFQTGQVVMSDIQLINLDNLTYTTDPITFTVNGTSGIENVTASQLNQGAIYNLQGVKVAAENLNKGVYIQNGKKFVIK
jgi:hypothetical protein